MINDNEDLKNCIKDLKNRILSHTAMINSATNDADREKWTEELEAKTKH